MEYSLSNIQLYSYACLVFITTGVVCGIIRWFHMCRPFDENGDYHYPARRLTTFFYIAIALEFPFLLNPMDSDIWIYIRCFGVIYYPVCFTLLFRSYFQRKKLKGDMAQRLFLFIPLAMIVALMCIVLSDHRHLLSSNEGWLLPTVGGVSLVLTAFLLHITNWMRVQINKFNTDNYSNVEDFAYKFASLVIYLPLIWIAGMWAIFISGSHWCKFAIDIAYSAWMIYFLCLILHPQKFTTNKLEQPAEATSGYDEGTCVDPLLSQPSIADTIGNDVLDIIRRRYREPHLQKSEVLAEIPKGKVNAASKYISQLGYYNLVNMFRLQHAALYKEAHPLAKQEVIAEESGFSSRTAYYKARKSVTAIDPDIVSGVTL